jgi:DNA-directed RNA polymerase specialized sigma24 family protein
VANEARLIFLMLVFEPIRRSVTKALERARSGLHPEQRDTNWANRQEARMIAHVERERVFDITREAVLEAIYRYPANADVRLFLWMRETIAHRSLDHLRGELPELGAQEFAAADARVVQEFLSGFSELEEPVMREGRGLQRWRLQIQMRSVFETVAEFYDHDPVREVCRTAVGRLPQAQRDVIDAYFFEDVSVPLIATRRSSSTSTVYNLKARAQATLESDNVFFSALCALDRVRDQARAMKLAADYPDGRLPDGRRIVHIGAAA